TPTPAPVPAGSHDSAVIVLISDGENNESPSPAQAAGEAAQRGVRIFTVGMGSEQGTILDLNGFKVHTQLQAGTLQQIAEATDGTYFGAASADDLASVYDHLDAALVVKAEAIELTAVFAGVGLVLLLAGALASLFWLGRLP
ncbi:MAG TPA: VWA domain-containing protein, partial [Candidatus Limnocylindrales bacterium]|nr:VWA domain-containing protein [Candidatus Limnocylindrales bacterium]